MLPGGTPLRRVTSILGFCLVAWALAIPAAAQSYRLTGITPIFDGWEELPDGSRLMYFGYINRQPTEVDIPVGPGNGFQTGVADRGQPTHFLQGRHEHVFTIKVPRTMTGKLVWAIKTPAGTQAANASFDQLYILAVRENDDPHAKPPLVEMGEVSARAGQPVTLAPRIVPALKSGRAETEGGVAEATGLNVAWSAYRGPGRVTFAENPRAPAAVTISAGRERGGRASPPRPGIQLVPCGTTPAPGCGSVTATFHEPGLYRLRIAARQDGLEGLGFVQVNVTPQ
jgi:hypothetical protein